MFLLPFNMVHDRQADVLNTNLRDRIVASVNIKGR
jgi:hypothetical protein